MDSDVSLWEHQRLVLGLEANAEGSGSSSACSALRCEWHLQYFTCQRIPQRRASRPHHQNSPWTSEASGLLYLSWAGFVVAPAPWKLMFLLMNVDDYIFTFDNVLLLVTDELNHSKLSEVMALKGWVKIKWNMISEGVIVKWFSLGQRKLIRSLRWWNIEATVCVLFRNFIRP